jgi:ubiquinone/menaquinone biosynthesis C-methylase UbiE
MTDDLPHSPERVRETYDRIASHFAETRHAPWPEVESFLETASDGEVGLDLGCGNGRHVPGLLERVDAVLCLDSSRALLVQTRQRTGHVADGLWLGQADAAHLPVGDETVDLALYVATLPHMATREMRIHSLRELRRVLDADGTALISAWSTAHERFDADADQPQGFDTTVDWTLSDGETVPRFYHIYAPAEFDADLEETGLEVVESYVSSGNCYAEVRP